MNTSNLPDTTTPTAPSGKSPSGKGIRHEYGDGSHPASPLGSPHGSPHASTPSGVQPSKPAGKRRSQRAIIVPDSDWITEPDSSRVGRRRTTRPARTTADRLGRQLAGLARQLTRRDRELCHLVFEHRVLTTHQLAQLAFDNLITAECRLVALYRLDLLDRFRPRRDCGSAPYHYVLGGLGAALLAAERGIEPHELGWRRDKALAIAYNQRLGHIVGVNGFFCALAGYARRHPRLGAELTDWWPERRCRQTWGEIVQPDGFGRWRERHDGDDEVLDFFLEYDNGTEPTHRVAAKLDGYAALAHAKDLFTPTLFWLPTPGREANIRRALADTHLPVATANPLEPSGNPAEAVWLPLGQTWPRRRLIDLADPETWRARASTLRPPQAADQNPSGGIGFE